MSKYIGLKPAEIAEAGDERAVEADSIGGTDTPLLLTSSSFGLKQRRKLRLPRVFLFQLLFCCLFTAAFMLIGFIDNAAVKNVLDAVYDALTFDLIGTNPAACIVNAWVSGIL